MNIGKKDDEAGMLFFCCPFLNFGIPFQFAVFATVGNLLLLSKILLVNCVSKNILAKQQFTINLGDTAFFYNLDKSIVLQECRAFNETPINSRKCRITLTKLVYLLYQSEHLQTKEATEAFFSITKLFQSADVSC